MHPILDELKKHFERSIVISLNRSLEFYDRLYDGIYNPVAHGIFPEYFRGIDAAYIKPPPYWGIEIPALWACGESHRQCIARALSDNVKTALIMEDDCAFVPDAAEKLAAFMPDVPEDWDGIMLGGQVSVFDGKTTPITPRVSKCVQVERLHCYALNRRGMQKFHDILCEPTNVANDYRWGDAQQDGRLTVYRIEPFIAYQTDGLSAISGRVEANRIWDDRVDVRLRKPEQIPVVALVCPYDVMTRLRDEGVISNGGESPVVMAYLHPGRAEKGEREIADMLLNASDEIRDNFVAQLRRDAAFHRHGVFAVWHPTQAIGCDADGVVRTDSYEDALNQIMWLGDAPVAPKGE